MEFDFTVPGLGIEHITEWDSAAIRTLSPADLNNLRLVVDTFGKRSAQAQGLTAPITDVLRLRSTDQRLLLCASRQPGGHTLVLGGIKVGTKRLFVSTATGALREIEPLCVLDFYVHESCQRQGIGKQLFEHLLQGSCDPASLAYDRPSPKFMAFLKRYYGLAEHIPQSNNFVVFNKYWSSQGGAGGPQQQSTSMGRASSGGRRAAAPAAPATNGSGFGIFYQPSPPQRGPSPNLNHTPGSPPSNAMSPYPFTSNAALTSSSPYATQSPGGSASRQQAYYQPDTIMSSAPYATSHPLSGGSSLPCATSNALPGGTSYPPSQHQYSGETALSPRRQDAAEDSIDQFRQTEGVMMASSARGGGSGPSTSAYSSPGATLMQRTHNSGSSFSHTNGSGGGDYGGINHGFPSSPPPPMRSTSLNGGGWGGGGGAGAGAGGVFPGAAQQLGYDPYQTSSQRMYAGAAPGYPPLPPQPGGPRTPQQQYGRSSTPPQQQYGGSSCPGGDALSSMQQAYGSSGSSRHGSMPPSRSTAPWANGGTWSAPPAAASHDVATAQQQHQWGGGSGGGYGATVGGEMYGGARRRVSRDGDGAVGSPIGGPHGISTTPTAATARVAGAQQRAGSGAANCLVW